MLLASFVADRINRSIDLDGWYGPQCTDLVNAYLQECLHIPAFAGNAVDFATQSRPGLVWVANGPTNSPPAGAVVVWAASNRMAGTGIAGHCAIALVADASKLISLDQNWNRQQKATVVAHDYSGVLGWHAPR